MGLRAALVERGSMNDQRDSDNRDADFSESSQDTQQTSPETADAAATSTEGAQADEVERLRAEVAEFREKYLRALAETDNVQKRARKERSDLIKYQGERILADMVEVLDNLELALAHADADPGQLKAGLQLVHKQFVDTLSRWEVRPESALGQEFDPTKFEAISKVTVDDAKPGTVINELKKAYFYKDRLLRVGSVVVAVEPTPEDRTGETSAQDEGSEGESGSSSESKGE
jgi:molecular chaperone GrpE